MADTNIEEMNAVVGGWRLGDDDHGGIGIALEFDLANGLSQDFGMYDLRWWGGYIVERLLAVLGVEDIKEATGRVVRVRRENRAIVAIGHPVRDVWFEPRSREDHAAAIAAHRKIVGESTPA
mgnify:CR=1 FL=1